MLTTEGPNPSIQSLHSSPSLFCAWGTKDIVQIRCYVGGHLVKFVIFWLPMDFDAAETICIERSSAKQGLGKFGLFRDIHMGT